ncbi:MAG: thioredoxin family protein [Thermoplasmata archaeon]|nr:thioredoxin family protein [Thermoplasmata archaeon]
MRIEVFGTGCPKCNMLEANVRKVLEELGVKAEVVKVTSIDEMVERGLMALPALVMDGELVVSGRVPSVAEIRDLVQTRGSVG